MRRAPLLLALPVLVAASLYARASAAEPRFGLELSAGQNIGLTSYVDNVVVLQGDLPLLADDLPGSGLAAHLNFIFNAWAVGMRLRLFDRSTVRLHHRGTTPLPPGRVRANGSVDDSGIRYEPIDVQRSPTPSAEPGNLMMLEVGASYRFYVLDDAFALWFPVGGSVAGVKILETSQPMIVGLGASTGVGIGYTIAPPVGIVLQGDIAGILTPAYRPLSDASRGSYAVGETTEEAVFSTMAYVVVTLGLQFTIR